MNLESRVYARLNCRFLQQRPKYRESTQFLIELTEAVPRPLRVNVISPPISLLQQRPLLGKDSGLTELRRTTAAPQANHLARVLARLERAAISTGRPIQGRVRRCGARHGAHAAQQFAG